MLSCAAAAYGSVVAGDTMSTNPNAAADRASALFGLVGVLVAQNRPEDVRTTISASVAKGDGGSSHLLTVAPVAAALIPDALVVAAKDSARFGADYGRCSTTERCWTLMQFMAFRRNAIAVDTIAAFLARRTTPDSDTYVQKLTEAARAQSILLHGDTTAALVALNTLFSQLPTGTALTWFQGGGLGAERLVFARVLVARHEYGQARRVADGFDASPASSHLVYLRASLELRMEIARKQQDVHRETQYRERLKNLST
jgi:hypothetical protein